MKATQDRRKNCPAPVMRPAASDGLSAKGDWEVVGIDIESQPSHHRKVQLPEGFDRQVFRMQRFLTDTMRDPFDVIFF